MGPVAIDSLFEDRTDGTKFNSLDNLSALRAFVESIRPAVTEKAPN
jgi:hypothetical protein